MITSTLNWLISRAPSLSIGNSFRRFADDAQKLSGHTHRVNNFEKKLLVWGGKYKTIEEIPAYVAPETVEKVRSKMRIRVANWMMVLTLVGCVAMVYSGKKARERGESVHQYNLDWHKQNIERDETVKDK